jgi:ADP-heptose:LPS heptosyltransferase
VIRTILVYSMGEVIGDGLIKLPFVAGLRAAFPDARITWCAAKGETVYAGPLSAVVEGYIDEIVTTGPNGDALLDLAPWRRPFDGRRFDLVIDTQENGRRSLAAKRGAKRFISPAGRFLFSDARPDAPWPEAVVDRLAVLLALAKPGASPAPLSLRAPDAVAAAEHLLPSGPQYVGLAPGAGGQEKRWPLEHYIELAHAVEASGGKPVFFFGPDEAADAALAADAVPEGVFPERSRTDPHPHVRGPLLVIALAARLAAAVANDAGPGHMLAAGGAPLLSLQKDRRKAVKFRPAACRLEMLVAEDYGDGMAALPVADAAAALRRLMAGA